MSLSRTYRYRAITAAHLQRAFGWLLGVGVPPKIAVVAIVKNDAGQYLVVDLSYRAGLALPGGLVDPHESLEEALAREVTEETGLTITKQVYVTSRKAVQYGISVISAGFVVEATGEVVASEEGRPLWVSRDEYLQNAAYENSREVFVHYLETYESHRR